MENMTRSDTEKSQKRKKFMQNITKRQTKYGS